MVKEYAGIDNTSSPDLLSHWQTVCLVVASIYGIIYGLIFSPFYMPNKQQHGGRHHYKMFGATRQRHPMLLSLLTSSCTR